MEEKNQMISDLNYNISIDDKDATIPDHNASTFESRKSEAGKSKDRKSIGRKSVDRSSICSNTMGPQ